MANEWEEECREIGLTKIAGADEVGRGCGSGPVVVAAVMLPVNHKIKGLRDSKKLTAKKREELASLIHERAISVNIAPISHEEIDKINILNATKKGMKLSLSGLKVTPHIALIDGRFSFSGEYALDIPYMCRDNGESLSENVAAASIVAKVWRDSYMKSMHAQYPQYGWDTSFGYLTKKHIDAIYEYGPCPLHRLSFSIKGVSIGDIKPNEQV